MFYLSCPTDIACRRGKRRKRKRRAIVMLRGVNLLFRSRRLRQITSRPQRLAANTDEGMLQYARCIYSILRNPGDILQRTFLPSFSHPHPREYTCASSLFVLHSRHRASRRVSQAYIKFLNMLFAYFRIPETRTKAKMIASVIVSACHVVSESISYLTRYPDPLPLKRQFR